MQDRRYDLAIVGAGFSGPILAAKIAERGVKPGSGNPLAIALIDAGPYYKGAARPGYGSALRHGMNIELPTDLIHGGTKFGLGPVHTRLLLPVQIVYRGGKKCLAGPVQGASTHDLGQANIVVPEVSLPMLTLQIGK